MTLWIENYSAEFRPKKLDDLKPKMHALIGVHALWYCVGTSGADEPYPGQTRWMTRDERFDGKWVPAEDLKPCPDGAAWAP
jgi:hypothetical protein